MCERIFVEQQEEKEINARKLYDDDEDEPVDTTKGWTQEIERRKLKWWERLLYQKEVTENILKTRKKQADCLKKTWPQSEKQTCWQPTKKSQYPDK